MGNPKTRGISPLVPDEENDDESDLGGEPMQLGADNGDASLFA